MNDEFNTLFEKMSTKYWFRDAELRDQLKGRILDLEKENQLLRTSITLLLRAEDRSYKKIANEMGINIRTAECLVHSAVLLLSDLLDIEGGNETEIDPKGIYASHLWVMQLIKEGNARLNKDQ